MTKANGTLLTLAEVSERFGVSIPRVAAWIQRGELRAINVSRSTASTKPQFRVSSEAVEEFERSRTVFMHKRPSFRRRPAYEKIV
jgi:transposase